MTFSIVIPTKNRPKELTAMFNSIIEQTRLPDQVIIIDQSKSKNLVKTAIESLIKETSISLKYIHDEGIKGLVQAKAASLKFNECDIISFFDDDIVLRPNYLFEISKAFKNHKLIMGANGIIINRPEVNNLNNLIFNFFHIGLFQDNRQSISNDTNDSSLLPVNTLSGGLSSWRKEVFDKVKFDIENNFHAYEDKEFSIRVNKTFPNSMFVIPNATLYHFHAQSNRESSKKRTYNDIKEVLIIFKKNGNFNYLGFDLILMSTGLFLKSILMSLKNLDYNFIILFLKGFYSGLNYPVKILK